MFTLSDRRVQHLCMPQILVLPDNLPRKAWDALSTKNQVLASSVCHIECCNMAGHANVYLDLDLRGPRVVQEGVRCAATLDMDLNLP